MLISQLEKLKPKQKLTYTGYASEPSAHFSENTSVKLNQLISYNSYIRRHVKLVVYTITKQLCTIEIYAISNQIKRFY